MAGRAEAIGARAWSVTVRLGRYLGPLLWDAVKYLTRLTLDGAGGLRILFVNWRSRRNPGRAEQDVQAQARVRERRAARWVVWRTLPAARRMEIRAAAVAVAAIALVAVRMWWEPSQATMSYSTAVSPPPQSNVEPNASPVQPAAESPAPPGEPPVDPQKVAAQFAADRQRLRPGEWAVLEEPLAIERGSLGAWDDQLIAQPVVLRDEFQGAAYRLWFRGCRMAVREYACGVGHATSRDGVAWDKAPRPVFVPPDEALREGLDEIAVLKTGGRYFLWYSVTADPFKGRRRATLHVATSPDGVTWTNEGKVLDGANDRTIFLWHSVFHDGRLFHLWYVAKEQDDPSPTLLHFTSEDGRIWSAMGGKRTAEIESRITVSVGRLAIVGAADGQFLALFTHDTQWQASGVLGSLVWADGTDWMATAVDVDPMKTWSSRYWSVFALSGASDRDGLWLWAGVRHGEGPLRVGVAFRKGSDS
ncbi:MAG TPA: hypothetical protein VMO26_24320 [Vicinamibacterales bacterium]|nr:hypothetical protein [Vicinamibacterales bacterium]